MRGKGYQIGHSFFCGKINRGNLSKILGELMMLAEADKRGPRHIWSPPRSEVYSVRAARLRAVALNKIFV